MIRDVKRESEFDEKFNKLFGDYPGINSEICLYRFVKDMLDDQIKIVATLLGDKRKIRNGLILTINVVIWGMKPVSMRVKLGQLKR